MNIEHLESTLLNMAKAGAAQLLDEGKEVLSLVFYTNGNAILATPIMRGETEDEARNQTRIILKSVSEVCSCFVTVTEMWFAEVSKEEEQRRKQGEQLLRPSLRSDRKEGVLITLYSRHLGAEFWTMKFERKDGKLISRESEWSKVDNMNVDLPGSVFPKPN